MEGAPKRRICCLLLVKRSVFEGPHVLRGHAWGLRTPDMSVGFPPDGHITFPGLYDARDPGGRAETSVHRATVAAGFSVMRGRADVVVT